MKCPSIIKEALSMKLIGSAAKKARGYANTTLLGNKAIRRVKMLKTPALKSYTFKSSKKINSLGKKYKLQANKLEYKMKYPNHQNPFESVRIV